MAHDVPVCVHSKLDTGGLLRLAQDGVIVGVKDSSGDDIAFRRLVTGSRGMGLSVLTGHEVVVDACLLMGADGVVPGLGNVDPHGYVRLVRAVRDGDWVAAKAEQERLAALFSIVDVAPADRFGGNAVGAGSFKTACAVLGVIASNAVSSPMERLGSLETAAVRDVLDRAGRLGL